MLQVFAGMRALRGMLLALLLVGCPPGIDPAPRPQGVVLISLDTLRADRLGAYGYARPTSPAIDALAAEGVLFEQAMATSPWTLPSHASLLTGLYPHVHGLTEKGRRLPSEVARLAALVAAAGYRTVGIVSSLHLSERSGLHEGFEHYEYVNKWNLEGRERRLHNPGPEITARALHWLDELAAGPFFLFLHYYDAHSDYSPRLSYREGLVDAYRGPLDGTTSQIATIRDQGLSVRPADARYLSQLYDAEIRQLDDEMAALLAHLDALGLADSTLVVLTSDHGEEFFEHGSVLHSRTYFEEVIRVPLLLRGPGLPRGRRIDGVASGVDVAPTVLGLLGLSPAPGMQGVDLSLSWRGGAPERDFVIAEADFKNESPGMYRMLRTDRYKLIHDLSLDRAALFDLRADPSEQAPLQEGALAQRLSQQLSDAIRETRRADAAAPLDAEEEELLRRLGYGN